MSVHLSAFFQSVSDQHAMEFIDQSNVNWFLTGSRFFGGFDNGSDWDFFTEYTAELANKCVEWGFEQCTVYKSLVNVSEVYKLGNIHVQLVKDAALKEKIQNKIKERITMPALTHHQRKEIWHLAYALMQVRSNHE